jgi:hypothetical protein
MELYQDKNAERPRPVWKLGMLEHEKADWEWKLQSPSEVRII